MYCLRHQVETTCRFENILLRVVYNDMDNLVKVKKIVFKSMHVPESIWLYVNHKLYGGSPFLCKSLHGDSSRAKCLCLPCFKLTFCHRPNIKDTHTHTLLLSVTLNFKTRFLYIYIALRRHQRCRSLMTQFFPPVV